MNDLQNSHGNTCSNISVFVSQNMLLIFLCSREIYAGFSDPCFSDVRKTGKSDFSIYFQNFLKQESWKTQLGMMVSGQ